MRVVFLPAAREDILHHIDYFSAIGQDAIAVRFLEAVGIAVENVAQTPNAGAPHPMRHRRLAGLRTWPIEGFDAVKVYYLVGTGEISILRVLHGRRDIEGILGE